MKSEAKNILAVVGVFAKLQEKDNPKLEPLVISVVEFQAGGKIDRFFAKDKQVQRKLLYLLK